MYENTKNPRSETSRGSGRGRGKTQWDLGAVLKTEKKGEGRRKELGRKEKEQKDKVKTEDRAGVVRMLTGMETAQAAADGDA